MDDQRREAGLDRQAFKQALAQAGLDDRDDGGLGIAGVALQRLTVRLSGQTWVCDNLPAKRSTSSDKRAATSLIRWKPKAGFW